MSLLNPITTVLTPYKLYFILAGCGILIGVGAYGTYRWLEADRIRLEDELIASKASLENLSENYVKLSGNLKDEQAQSAERSKREAKLVSQNASLRQALVNLRNAKDDKGQPTTESILLNTLIPTTVRELRRTDASCPKDLSMQCPNSEPLSDDRAPNGGRNSGRSSRGGWTVTPLPAVLQFRQGSHFGLDSKGTIQEVGLVEVIPKGDKR